MNTNQIIQGDCIEELKKLPENSIDAIITDPPYGIGFMGKEWDNFKPENIDRAMEKDKRPKTQIASTRTSNTAGTYDLSLKGKLGFQGWFKQVSMECLRVLKPGGFLLSFGGTRTYHRLVCGIEDAGFEIRDTIMWLYGSGFPKSTSISLLFDKRECMKQLKEKLGRKPTKDEFKKSWENFRKVVGKRITGNAKQNDNLTGEFGNFNEKQNTSGQKEIDITSPATKEAKQWEGWGTALKPACEPIVVARKPLSEKNVALNVLKHGTGGLNIDACRVEGQTPKRRADEKAFIPDIDHKWGSITKRTEYDNQQGRFPSNIILDEEAGKMLDEQSGESKAGDYKGEGSKQGGIWQKSMGQPAGREYGDKGGASRFFYCPKASKSERNFGLDDEPYKNRLKELGNKWTTVDYREGRKREIMVKNNHPTVKPIKLMEYLIKLISREGAIILDPFIGSGTTAIACLKLNRKFIGIEKEEEYVKIAEARIKPFQEQTKLT